MDEIYVPIFTKGETGKVKVSDIILVERYNRKIRIITGEKEYCYYEKIENLSVYLDDRFYLCMKGCYINLERVIKMSNQSIKFDNGFVYNMGRDNFLHTRQKYVGYLKETSKKACNSKLNSL